VSDDRLQNGARSSLLSLLGGYQPQGAAEARDVERIAALARTAPDPWLRSMPLHVTASALVVHPDSGRVLLRWHPRVQDWLQVGGHGDPGEHDALAVALREAREETGLADLTPWPDEALRHVAVVPVPAGRGERAHEHGDLRFFLATRTPAAATAESVDAALRWLTVGEAAWLTGNDSVREALTRVRSLLATS
jgi:8-oxo-dGTP pyrophosphatase MutT (NUDIX family)